MSAPSDKPHQVGGASPEQIGWSNILRYGPGVTKEEYDELSAIGHSADKRGKYAKMDNLYKDLTHTFDPKAEKKLEASKAKQGIQ